MHVLCTDGVYTRVDGKPLFRNLDAITDKEVASLIEAISQKTMRYLKKQGYLDKDGELVRNPLLDELFDSYEALIGATAASIAGKIAFGPNAGNYVTRIGKGFGYGEEFPLAKSKRCFTVNGFSLHANTRVNALARDRLEKLIHYIARGPLANERLELTDDRRVKVRLKTPYTDGTTHLLLTYGEFVEKLVALVPLQGVTWCAGPVFLHQIRLIEKRSPSKPRSKRASNLKVPTKKMGSKTTRGQKCWPRSSRSRHQV